MNNKTSFVEYYSAIGKPITNGESYSKNDCDVKILKCEENEYIDIKPDFKILGAYVLSQYQKKNEKIKKKYKQILRMSQSIQERNQRHKESD